MELADIIFIIFLVIVVFLIIFKWSDVKSTEEELFDLEQELDIPYKDRFYNKEDEEIFHHPVTGYSGNRANMDAYIINREKKLKNEN